MLSSGGAGGEILEHYRLGKQKLEFLKIFASALGPRHCIYEGRVGTVGSPQSLGDGGGQSGSQRCKLQVSAVEGRDHKPRTEGHISLPRIQAWRMLTTS